jgi:hypothetical protein
MKRIYLLMTAVALCTSGLFAQLIINEVLYDPSNSSLDGDANGDGVYDQDGDAFIEFFNDGLAILILVDMKCGMIRLLVLWFILFPLLP